LISESARVESALKSGSLLTIAGVFFAAGLLLAFTPCVLPMVPILSSIIVGQGAPVSRVRGLSMALAYSLGMALVYTAFGVVAGLLGEGLAAALQNPWVLGAFALMLATLSLSMFGVFELQMPGFVQSRLTETSSRLPGGRFVGVFLMGGLSALIVGPCVAAPLAGALVFISQTKNVVIGGLALFSLAMGMSVPLLLVGVSAGSLLPRAGAWMNGVKSFFGVLLLAVALWIVSPVVPGWALMVVIGAALLIGAVYLTLFDKLAESATGRQRLAKGVALVLAVLGTTQVVGALSGGSNPVQPLAHLARGAAAAAEGAATKATDFRRVRNLAELDDVLKTARRPVVLDFYADWCVSCKEMEHFTFNDSSVRTRMAGALLLQADVTANSADDKALLKRFGLFGPPGILFFDSQGHEQAEARVIGFLPPQRFAAALAAAGL
jgi:thioredoxin:protein disulfide reductase